MSYHQNIISTTKTCFVACLMNDRGLNPVLSNFYQNKCKDYTFILGIKGIHKNATKGL